MRTLKLSVLALFALALLVSQVPILTVSSQSGSTEAPASFDNQTNGFTDQASFDSDRAAFERRAEVATGLGPVYNAQSCAECHQSPVTGGVSQIFELRAGHSGPDGSFVAPPGGSLIQARAVNAQIQERVPDGSRIVFRGPSAQISVMGFDGGQYGLVGNTPMTGIHPSFSPDGKQVVFARSTGTGNNTTIRVMSDDGTNLRQITADSAQDKFPAWSPDGAKIAFASNRTGRWQIFTMNPDGTNQTQISNGSADDSLPAWSPDGTKIAFTRTPAVLNARSAIWQFNPDGSGQTQLTFSLTANDGWPACLVARWDHDRLPHGP
jgi:WD40 repeat protein